MITIEKTTPQHVLALRDVEPRSGFKMEWIDMGFAVDVARGESWTALDSSGAVLGVAGFERGRTHREAECFTMLSRGWKRHARAITDAVMERMALAPYPRLFMMVSADDFPEGHRWARYLGFALEAPRVRGYWHGGNDMSLYGQYRPWLEEN